MLARHVGSLQLRGTRVLDMGTGSGVVGIFAEKAGALVLATDINPVAVMTATKNAALNHCSNFSARVSDLFEAIDTHEGFDLIAWNPPFYASVPTDIPSHAWYAGSRYAVIRRFAAVASDHLRPGGAALLVLSSDLDLPQLFLIFAENLWRANVLELRKGIFEDHLLVSLTRCGPVGGLSGG
jgi:release factor glutamine methyltransferase